MDDHLLQRLEALERSNRRWKAFALVLAAALLGGSATGTYFFVQYAKALHAMEATRLHEMQVREEAEAVRQQLEAQLRRKKE